MIGKALRAILVADADVNALVSGRVYPNRARQGVSQPYAVYTQVSGESIMALSGHSGLGSATFQVDVFDDNYSDAHDVAEKVRLALQDYRATISGVVVQDCQAGSARDDLGVYADGRETGVARVTRDFTFWFTEASP